MSEFTEALVLPIGVGRKHRGRVRNVEWSWDKLIEKLSVAEVGRETLAEYRALSKDDQLVLKNVGFFVAGTCRDGVRRKENVECRSLVCLDFDDVPEALFSELREDRSGLRGIEFFLHTTRKHAAPVNVRFRVVVPLATPIEPVQYEPVARLVASWIDPEMQYVDKVSFRASQYMFWPSKCVDGEFLAERHPGSLLDGADVLGHYTVWTDPGEWPRRDDETLHVNTNADVRRDDPRQRLTAPTLAAFCRVYDVHEAIATFLPDVYDEAPTVGEDRYTYTAGSSAGGARVYDDGLYLHSEHDTDPAHGQHNAFDLVRIHLYGHLDRGVDVSSLPLSSWPSFKAMRDLAEGDTRVRDILPEVEQDAYAARYPAFDDLFDDDDDDDLGGPLSDLLAPPEDKPERPKGPDGLLQLFSDKLLLAETIAALDKIARRVQEVALQDFSSRYRDRLADVYRRRTREVSEGRYTLTMAEAKKHLRPSDKTSREAIRRQGLPEWLENWVYVSGVDKFRNQVTGERISAAGFNAKHDHAMLDNFPADETGLPTVHAAEAATTLFRVPVPFLEQYWPGRGALYEHQGLEYANTYRDTGVQPDGYTGSRGVKLLMIHLRNILPDERDRALLLDWLAHIVQHPEHKLLYACLLKGVRGDGKTFFIELMRAVLGDANCKAVVSSMLKKEFNGWAADTLFCGVEEVKLHHGIDASDVLNALKPVVSNPVIAVERKGQDVVTQRNFANLFLTTNYSDAMPLSSGENRYLTLATRFRSEDELAEWSEAWRAEHGFDFHAALYDELADHPYQFRLFLETYEFSQWYNPNARAPRTSFMDEMVEDAKSDERQLVEDVLDRGNEPLLTERLFVWWRFKQLLDAELPGHRMRGRAVSSMMTELGFIRAGKERFAGKQGVIWSKDPTMRGQGAVLSVEGKAALLDAEARWAEVEDFDMSNVVSLRR